MNSYWLSRSSEMVEGPFVESHLMSMWQQGQFTARDQLCLDGTEDWMSASIVMRGIEDDVEMRKHETMLRQPTSFVREERAPRRKQESTKKKPGFSIVRVLVVVGIILGFVMWLGDRPSKVALDSMKESSKQADISDSDATTRKYERLARENGIQIAKASSVHFIQGRNYHALRLRGSGRSLDVLISDGSDKWVEIGEFISMCRLLGAAGESEIKEVERMRAELD